MSNNKSSFLGEKNDRVQVYKSMANYDMIGEMMNRQFGYSPKEFAASMRSMDSRVDATIGAWHVGNVFELHKDGAYGVVIAPIGDGTSSARAVSLEGVEAKHFAEDLTRARKSATELEQKDLRKGITSNDPEFHYRNAVDQVADEYFTTYSLMKATYLDSSHPRFGQEVGSAPKPKMAAPGQTQHFGGPRDGQPVHGTGTAQAMAQHTKDENNGKRQKFASFASPEELDAEDPDARAAKIKTAQARGLKEAQEANRQRADKQERDRAYDPRIRKGEEDSEEDDAPSYSSMRRQPPSARGTDKRDDRASGNGRMRSGRHQEGAKAIAADRSIRSAQDLDKSAEKRAANRARVAAENGQTFDPSKVGPSGSFQHQGGSWDKHVAGREDEIRHARAMEEHSQQDPNLPDDRPRRSSATFVQFRGKKNPPKSMDKSFAMSLLTHGRALRKAATGR